MKLTAKGIVFSCPFFSRCHGAYRLSLPEEQLGSAITWVAAVLLQLWRQIPIRLLFFLLSKAQAASSAVRPVPANPLSAVLNMQKPGEQTIRSAFDSLAEAAKLLSAVLSMQTPCEQTFRTTFYNRAEAASFCQQCSTCKHLVNRPSGLLIAVLQKQQAFVSSAQHANTW